MNRRTKLLASIAGAAALAGGIVYAAMPADAATADVQFSVIYYDSPGKDTRSNASLVAEYVRLTNRSAFPVNLAKWTLADKAGHKFTFPSHAVGAHRTVYIRTGHGTNGRTPAGKADSAQLYWNSGNYIWNNDGDTATLKSGSGRVYDSCSWKTGHVSTTCNYKAPAPLALTPKVAPTTARPTKTIPPGNPLADDPPPANGSTPSPPPDLPSGGGDPADGGPPPLGGGDGGMPPPLGG
jgi:hypothetical protein